MSLPKSPFMLSPEERLSVVWSKLKAHINEQIEFCRIQNDKALTSEETSNLRGRIAAYKQLLRAEQDSTYQD